jgi:DNA-binding transcriptional MerR regulator
MQILLSPEGTPMHEWDIAASNPCPFCFGMELCPMAHNPSDQCLEFWPLGRPQHRALTGGAPDERRWRAMLLSNPGVEQIIEHWLSGAQVSDTQHLHLRSLTYSAPFQDAANAYWYLFTEMLYPKTARYLEHAIGYYGLSEPSPIKLAQVSAALRGGVATANEYMVRNDSSVRVPSHFERIVFEALKTMIFILFGVSFLRLPRATHPFRREVEREWRRVLCYGNGLYGFTVFPRIHMEDLVRYQLLRDKTPLVSWSISNWVIWSMTAFPSPVQIVCPEFGHRAFGVRLRRMYEPLVQSYATKLVTRAERIDGQRDAPKRADVVGELQALLSHLIEEYDFNYGKPDAMLSSVGTIGPESSPRWREDLDQRFGELGLPFRAHDVAHVGFPRYVVGKFEEHLRESYRWNAAEFGQADRQSGVILEGTGEAAEVFAEETKRTRRKSDAGPSIPVAFEKGGMRYLYIEQMAMACGVTVDQLRNWDRRGCLETLRVRDIDPGAPATIANRRVYPYTEEMLSQIKELAERKDMLQADPREGLLSRQEAADRLGISTRTLDNWRKDGRIAEVKIEHRVFISEDEVERLLAEQDET